VNPRKFYPVDPGLIPAFDRTGRPNTGHALETTVLIELERRSCAVAYVRTETGHEHRFSAASPEGKRPTFKCVQMPAPPRFGTGSIDRGGAALAKNRARFCYSL